MENVCVPIENCLRIWCFLLHISARVLTMPKRSKKKKQNKAKNYMIVCRKTQYRHKRPYISPHNFDSISPAARMYFIRINYSYGQKTQFRFSFFCPFSRSPFDGWLFVRYSQVPNFTNLFDKIFIKFRYACVRDWTKRK